MEDTLAKMFPKFSRADIRAVLRIHGSRLDQSTIQLFLHLTSQLQTSSSLACNPSMPVRRFTVPEQEKRRRRLRDFERTEARFLARVFGGVSERAGRRDGKVRAGDIPRVLFALGEEYDDEDMCDVVEKGLGRQDWESLVSFEEFHAWWCAQFATPLLASRPDENEHQGLAVCSICIEEFQERDFLRQLPCSHEFHLQCIDTWLHTSATEGRRCPVCRSAVAL